MSSFHISKLIRHLICICLLLNYSSFAIKLHAKRHLRHVSHTSSTCPPPPSTQSKVKEDTVPAKENENRIQPPPFWSKFPKALINVPQISRGSKRDFKLIFLLFLLSIETSSEIYVRLPQQIIYGSSPRSLPLEKIDGKRNVLLIFPGAGGPDANSDQLEAQIQASDKKAGYSRWVYTYDWLQWRGPFVRAAFDGQLVGRSVCGELAKSPRGNDIDSLHVIGISVGAFAADSCTKTFTKTLKETNPIPPHTHTSATRVSLTLLDPFTSKGIFGYAWGEKYFGTSADSMVTYLNTDDPVPSTSNPLSQGITVDITHSKQRQDYHPPDSNMHSWPVAYLAKNWITEPTTGDTKLSGVNVDTVSSEAKLSSEGQVYEAE